MKELNTLLDQYSSKNYTTLIKNRPALYNFLINKYGDDLTIPEMLWCYANNEQPVMCHCGNTAKFNTFTKGYRVVCSTACKGAHHKHKMTEFWDQNPDIKVTMQAKKEKTNLQKYGNKNAARNADVIAKTKATNIERYGTETPLQSAIVQQKIKLTTQEKYGVDYPFQSKDIIKKGHETTVSRYGSLMSQARKASYLKYDGVNPFASEEVKAKIKEHNINKYNTSYFKQSHFTEEQKEILFNEKKFKEHITGKTITQAGLDIGVSEGSIARRCDLYDVRGLIAAPTNSQWEEKIKRLLDDHGVRYEQNTKKVIAPYELDFFLPDFKVAIEVGSIFWHSDHNAKRGKDYHVNKYTSCKKLGITLYQWFDDELTNLFPIIENKILYIINKITAKIGARKCSIVKSGNTDLERKFLIANHIQGFSTDRKRTYIAYYHNEIVGLISFAQRKQYLELTRFAVKQNTVISGLFSKMLKYAIADMLYTGVVVSFSNNNHSNGALYKHNGFVIDNELGPAYYYTKDYHTRLNRQGFMKSKIAKKFNYDMTGKTEWQAMQELGYDRIWDSGKIKWVYTV